MWVNIYFLDKSKRNQSTFNWDLGKKYLMIHNFIFLSSDTSAVPLNKYPKAFLKAVDSNGKKVNLNKYLKVTFKEILKPEII